MVEGWLLLGAGGVAVWALWYFGSRQHHMDRIDREIEKARRKDR